MNNEDTYIVRKRGPWFLDFPGLCGVLQPNRELDAAAANDILDVEL